MGVLIRLYRSIVYIDKLGRNIPSLVQVWLVEFIMIVLLAFFVGKLIDIRGWGSVPGTGESLDWTMWVSLLIVLACAFFFVRNLIFPRVRMETWTPMTHTGLHVGDFELLVATPKATVEYPFLTSHPSYVLLLLVTMWIPIIMVWMTADLGGNVLYWRMSGFAGLIIIAFMAVARFTAWYVFKLGQAPLRDWSIDSGLSVRRLGWETSWKPTVVLVALMYAIVGIPMAVMFWNEHRTIAKLPLATAAMYETAPAPYVFGSGTPRQWVRVEGTLVGKPLLWPAGENRGGNNYRGGGVRVALDAGGEALVLAESMSMGDLNGDLKTAAASDGRFKCSGYVVNSLSDSQTKYYGIDLRYFPDPPDDGRVLVIHGYP